MRFRILGPLEVLSPDGWTAIGAAKWRSLLACLLVRPGQLVPTETLMFELWGDNPPSTANNMVSIYVHRLRKVIGDTEGKVLVHRAPGYLLRVSPGDVDFQVFESLVASGRAALASAAPERAAGLLGEALGLWRGPLLADVAPSPLLETHADRAAELRLDTTELRAEADLACGRAAQVVAELRGLVTEHPLRERLWALLVRALEEAGRRAEALEAYAQARQVISDELGVDPGSELQRLVRIAVVNGAGGLGKTTLAVHAAHRVRTEFPDGQLYADLLGASAQPAEPGEVLARFLRDLGVDGDKVPARDDERAALYRTRLTGRRVAWYDDERANLTAAARQAAAAGLHDIAWRLPPTLFPVFNRRSNWAECVTMHRVAMESARKVGDRPGEAWVLNQLGFALARLRDREAFGHLEQALAIRRELGDTLGEAQTAIALGEGHLNVHGPGPDALRYLRHAADLLEPMGATSLRSVALNNLGEVYFGLDDLDAAAECYRQARDICREIGGHAEGHALHNLGRVFLRLHRLDEAIASFTEALRKHRAAGLLVGEARTLKDLAEARAETGNMAEARTSVAAAIRIFEQIGDQVEAAETASLLASLTAE